MDEFNQKMIEQYIMELNDLLENKNSYFCNYDICNNSPDFLEKLMIILDDEYAEEVITVEVEFQTAIKKLMDKKKLIHCNNMDLNLIHQLKKVFNIDFNLNLIGEEIDKYGDYARNNEILKSLIMINAITKQLEPQHYGFIELYSGGDFWCYGILPIKKIDELKYLFFEGKGATELLKLMKENSLKGKYKKTKRGNIQWQITKEVLIEIVLGGYEEESTLVYYFNINGKYESIYSNELSTSDVKSIIKMLKEINNQENYIVTWNDHCGIKAMYLTYNDLQKYENKSKYTLFKF